jgi:hypothetical protein
VSKYRLNRPVYNRDNYVSPTKTSPFKKKFTHPKRYDMRDYSYPSGVKGFAQNAVNRLVPGSYTPKVFVPKESNRKYGLAS